MIIFEDYSKVDYDISSAFFQEFDLPREYKAYVEKQFGDSETIQDTETGNYLYIKRANGSYKISCKSEDDYLKFINFVKTNSDVIVNEDTVSGDIAPTNQGFHKRVMQVRYPADVINKTINKQG